MEYNVKENSIILQKEISELDQFVIDFVSLLDNYVIVSGYVSIITGRSRATEDVGLLVPKLELDRFKVLWKKIHENGFDCLNTENIEEAYNLWQSHAVRFARKGTGIPNIEFKMIKNDIEKYSFDNKIKIILGDKKLLASPIEMQIAFKLSLGSDKDLEDAKHLYELFKDKINKDELLELIKELKVEAKFEIIK